MAESWMEVEMQVFTFFWLPTRRHGRGMGDAATLIGALILIFALQFPIRVTLSPTNTLHVGACLWESSEKVHCQVQSRKVHVLPGVDVHVQLCIARCKKEKVQGCGKHQRRYSARFKAEMVHF